MGLLKESVWSTCGEADFQVFKYIKLSVLHTNATE